MKSFRRLIPSLAASAMIAAATFAPLPGFLAAGSVHADPPQPLGRVYIGREAKFIDTHHINVPVEFVCSPVVLRLNTVATLSVSVTQTRGGTTVNGTGQLPPPSIFCNNHWQDISVPVSADGAVGGFNIGRAFATATLENANGAQGVADERSRIIDIEQ